MKKKLVQKLKKNPFFYQQQIKPISNKLYSTVDKEA